MPPPLPLLLIHLAEPRPRHSTVNGPHRFPPQAVRPPDKVRKRAVVLADELLVDTPVGVQGEDLGGDFRGRGERRVAWFVIFFPEHDAVHGGAVVSVFLAVGCGAHHGVAVRVALFDAFQHAEGARGDVAAVVECCGWLAGYDGAEVNGDGELGAIEDVGLGYCHGWGWL